MLRAWQKASHARAKSKGKIVFFNGSVKFINSRLLKILRIVAA
jgi:hypothetical protein